MSLFAPANLHSVFSAQADLLHSFILDVENQTEKGIADYRNGIGSDTTVVEFGDEGNGQAVKNHKGLDDNAWDLDAVFCDYFPNLQRGSALLTLFGSFDAFLFDFCYIKYLKYKEKEKKTPKPSYLFNYSDAIKFLRFERLVQDTSTAENELTNIALVRNKFAHSHAMIDRGEIDSDEKTKQLLDYVVSHDLLDINDSSRNRMEVVIQKGYLLHVLTVFNEITKQLDG